MYFSANKYAAHHMKLPSVIKLIQLKLSDRSLSLCQ